MARTAIIGSGKYIKRAEFNGMIITLTAVLGVILPLIPKENLNAFFHINNIYDLAIYIVLILVIVIITAIVLQIIGFSLINLGRMIKINVDVKEYLQDQSTPRYLSLRIINKEMADLTDYRAMMIIAEMFNNQSRVDILQTINPNDKLLSWGAGSETELVTIYGNEGSKVLNIGCESNRKFKFIFHNWESEWGLGDMKYHIKIKINGNIDGEPFPSIIYDGCFEIKNTMTIPYLTEKESQNNQTVYTLLNFIKCDDKNKRLEKEIS